MFCSSSDTVLNCVTCVKLIVSLGLHLQQYVALRSVMLDCQLSACLPACLPACTQSELACSRMQLHYGCQQGERERQARHLPPLTPLRY
jgi:hypothetical protein